MKPSTTHESTIVTHANPPRDARALQARAVLARLIQEAGPPPADYQPDETVTEDGSQIPLQQGYQRQQKTPSYPSHQRKPRKDDPDGEREAQEFLERQRRRTTERRRGEPGEAEEEYSPRKPPPAKPKGNYYEPQWACTPTQTYYLSVYKKKVLDHRINLSKKSYHIVGRMTDCDIQVHNNSISRYHAVFQHGQDGMYIYDLGSSNGTFLNDHKQLVNDGIVPKRKYKRICSSDIIMFGEYDRFYILEGGMTRQQFELRSQVQPNTSGFQFDDGRSRERDYRSSHPPQRHPVSASRGVVRGGIRRDIKSARDHFRARFENMQG